MSILIKGMEMPKSRGEYALRMYVHSDGTAIIEGAYCRFEGEPFVAVPVPPHGRLVDADKMIWRLTPNEEFYPTEKDRFDYDSGKLMVRDIRGFIRDQETIIPAEGGDAE